MNLKLPMYAKFTGRVIEGISVVTASSMSYLIYEKSL